MTATAYNGTGDWTYTNSTGGNVRIIVMSCRTSGPEVVNPVTGTITCGTATYPIYPNTTWGKGVVSNLGNGAYTPVEYILHDTGIFSIASTPTGGPTGQEIITNSAYTDLTSTWTVPTGVTNVSVVCVGAGGYQGNGGALAWKNNILVTPGASIPYKVGQRGYVTNGRYGGDTWFVDEVTCFAPGGQYAIDPSYQPAFVGDGGGQGRKGAGGYTGNGGVGSNTTGHGGLPGEGGGGGGNGAHYSYGSGGGGGVGLYGQGASGQGGSGSSDTAGTNGKGGSGGSDGPQGQYGGGGASNGSQFHGGYAAMRIIWGDGRYYPITNTVDDATGNDTTIESYNIVVIPE